jgi:hypothetical protein
MMHLRKLKGHQVHGLKKMYFLMSWLVINKLWGILAYKFPFAETVNAKKKKIKAIPRGKVAFNDKKVCVKSDAVYC